VGRRSTYDNLIFVCVFSPRAWQDWPVPLVNREIVNRDNGDPKKVSDWFNLCNLSQYVSTTSTIKYVALFIDESESMDLSTVRASHQKFLSDLNNAGIAYKQVTDSDENWIKPFLTTLVP